MLVIPGVEITKDYLNSDLSAHLLPPGDEAPHAKVARASWARFIKKVFAADPLE